MKESNDLAISSGTQDQRLNCPECGSKLQKCLIQQNYAIVMCVNTQCSYPFNRTPVIDNLVYVRENDVLTVAKQRLSDS